MLNRHDHWTTPNLESHLANFQLSNQVVTTSFLESSPNLAPGPIGGCCRCRIRPYQNPGFLLIGSLVNMARSCSHIAPKGIHRRANRTSGLEGLGSLRNSPSQDWSQVHAHIRRALQKPIPDADADADALSIRPRGSRAQMPIDTSREVQVNVQRSREWFDSWLVVCKLQGVGYSPTPRDLIPALPWPYTPALRSASWHAVSISLPCAAC